MDPYQNDTGPDSGTLLLSFTLSGHLKNNVNMREIWFVVFVVLDNFTL